MSSWDSIFKKSGRHFHEPHEDMDKIIKLLKKENVKRVLDLGCGSGRHTALLAQNGFDVYGMDVSKEGLKLTKEWLKELKLNAVLKYGSCYRKFPFNDGFFDAIISVQVIHHNYIEKVRFCISEIERVLKPRGILFVTVASPKKYYRKGDREKYKTIRPHTYVPTEGQEKGTIHYLYTKELIKKDFKNFKILSLYKDNSKHHCLLGKLKN